MARFKTFIADFGFDRKERENTPHADKPLHPFNVESLIEFLSMKKLGLHEAQVNFMNSIQWGTRPGATLLEISPRMSLHIKKLGVDLEGHTRWITKKVFQLNRNNNQNNPESVSVEVLDVLKEISATPLESPNKEYDLERLVQKLASKMERVAKSIFVFEGIKKLSNENFLIAFELQGAGVEARDKLQIDELLTQVTFDESCGNIKVSLYKVADKTGRGRSWKIQPSDLEAYFFPSQSVEEITESIGVFFKYY